MNLSIFCADYVGMVSGAFLAEARHHVANMDVDLVKIKKLKTSILPILEPDLKALVERNVMEGRLHFTFDDAYALQHEQVQFIARAASRLKTLLCPRVWGARKVIKEMAVPESEKCLAS
jgi:UDPglucose 6-dehydrogenase